MNQPPPGPFPPPGPQHPTGSHGFQQRPGAIHPPQPWHPNGPVGPGFPIVPRTPPARGNGWWIASAVLAFLGAVGAMVTLGLIVLLGGLFAFMAGAEGGSDGVHEMAGDIGWLLGLFVAVQCVSIVLGLWGGCNCLRGKRSGAIAAMVVGALILGQVIWLGLAMDDGSGMILGVLTAIALIVCAAIALRFPQPRRT